MTKRRFYENISVINSNQQIKSDCGDFTVINSGTSVAILNGVILNAGDQYISYANEQELNYSIYTINFDNTGINQVTVIRKIFQDQ